MPISEENGGVLRQRRVTLGGNPDSLDLQSEHVDMFVLLIWSVQAMMCAINRRSCGDMAKLGQDGENGSSAEDCSFKTSGRGGSSSPEQTSFSNFPILHVTSVQTDDSRFRTLSNSAGCENHAFPTLTMIPDSIDSTLLLSGQIWRHHRRNVAGMAVRQVVLTCIIGQVPLNMRSADTEGQCIYQRPIFTWV